MAARSAEDAKDIASRIPSDLQRDWNSAKIVAMKLILHAKADCCPIFKRTLLESDGKRLVGSTQDVFWASGLSPSDTVSTRPSYYPGSTHLGCIMVQVRSELLREASQLRKIDTYRHDDVTLLAAGDPPVTSTSTPDPVLLESEGILSDAPTSVTPIAQDDPDTSTATVVSDDSDHECEEQDMSDIEQQLDFHDTDTVTESAVVTIKKSPDKPTHKSQSPPTIRHKGVNISSAVQPTNY